MKKPITNAAFVLAAALLGVQTGHAQGTITYLSNLGQPSTGSNLVGGDSWLAAGFRTGPNAAGYLLDSVQLAVGDATGNPTGFTVMIYSNVVPFVAFVPGISLGTLTGSLNPVTGGIYTYTPTSSLALAPSTYYYVVMTAGTPVAIGAYAWSYVDTDSYDPVDSWLARPAYRSSDGSPLSWIRLGGPAQFDYSQFAIDATAIPEPGVFVLLGLGGLGFLWHRRNAMAVR